MLRRRKHKYTGACLSQRQTGSFLGEKKPPERGLEEAKSASAMSEAVSRRLIFTQNVRLFIGWESNFLI